MNRPSAPGPSAQGVGEPAVLIADLRKSFGTHEVLKGVDLQVARGEVVVIIGPSGSGKSTLLRCINMLERPDSGRVTVLGTVTTQSHADLPRLRRRVGMVFQSFNLFPHKTVLENVIEGPLTVLGMKREEAVGRGRELLRKVGLGDRGESRCWQLSGGQQQRVAIARALAMNPEIMLFDEVTSALDPELRAEVLEVMRQLATEGMTMVVVSHEMAFARKAGDRTVFIDGGVVVEEGRPAEMLENPQTERLHQFLNVLYWGEASG
jgi:polar amino acid transport system ATP-binding protein